MPAIQKAILGRILRIWGPLLFFAGVALGALLFAMTFLVTPTANLSSSTTALAGAAYATEQPLAFERNPWLVHIHAILGVGLVLVVPFQFWKRFRAKHRQLHRFVGYVLIGCLALLSTTGVAVAIVYPFSGLAGVIPNLVWSVGILFCLGVAFARIRHRDILGHEAWMTRAMAMTLGITFATLYLPILTGVLHLSSRTGLAVSFWLGVGECLTVAEVWLQRPGGPLARRRAP